MLRYTTELDLV